MSSNLLKLRVSVILLEVYLICTKKKKIKKKSIFEKAKPDLHSGEFFWLTVPPWPLLCYPTWYQNTLKRYDQAHLFYTIFTGENPIRALQRGFLSWVGLNASSEPWAALGTAPGAQRRNGAEIDGWRSAPFYDSTFTLHWKCQFFLAPAQSITTFLQCQKLSEIPLYGPHSCTLTPARKAHHPHYWHLSDIQL